MIDLQQINVWGTAGAAVAAFALGGAWFSPLLFGHSWAASLGKRPEEKGTPIVAMSFSLLTTLVQAFIIAALFQVAGLDTLRSGLAGGVFLAAIVFLSTLSDAAFTGAIKGRWWWIQALYRVLSILLMCAIVGISAPESPTHKMKRAVEKAGEAFQKELKDFRDSMK
jgi:hypothetical protein